MIVKRKDISIVLIICFLFSACNQSNPEKEEGYDSRNINSFSTENSEDDTVYCPSNVNGTYTSGDVQVVFDSLVESDGINNVSNVKLQLSEQYMIQMADDFIFSAEANAEQLEQGPYEYSWVVRDENDNLIMAYSVLNNGFIHYCDVTRDINGSSDEYEHMDEFGYITSEIPLGMNINSSEAATEAISLLESYSPFNYREYNTISVNDNERNNGYYRIRLEAMYENIPILIKNGGDDTYSPIRPDICISGEGFFDFQGRICFDVIEADLIDERVPFDSIIDGFVNDISILASGNTVEVYRIYLAYVPIDYQESDGTILVPAWCFDCWDSNQNNNQDSMLPITIAYSYESGSLIGTYY